MASVPFSPPLPQCKKAVSTLQVSGQCGGRSLPIGRLSLVADHCQRNSPGAVSRTSISAIVISCASAGAANDVTTSPSRATSQRRIERFMPRPPLFRRPMFDRRLVLDLVLLGELVHRCAALLGGERVFPVLHHDALVGAEISD